MNSNLVSILMPVKNAAPFLKACLESILAQTYTNWELIAVNDHSSDDTVAILADFTKRDNRIKVLAPEGKGIIPALQTAYKKSRGEFITRMDADDLMTEDKLAVMTQQLLQSGRGYLATGCVRYFSARELGQGYENYAHWLNELTRKGDNFSEIYKECVIPSPCWMIYREDFELCGAFNSTRYPEDYDLAFRFYKEGLKVIPSNQVLHHWRDYEVRTSRTDANYADNSFIPLKCHYFSLLDYDPNRQLVLWGAGRKGKQLAAELVKQHIPFRWVCNNSRKIGQYIHGVQLERLNSDLLNSMNQLIIAIASPADQEEILSLLENYNLTKGKDYFFFC